MTQPRLGYFIFNVHRRNDPCIRNNDSGGALNYLNSKFNNISKILCISEIGTCKRSANKTRVIIFWGWGLPRGGGE